MRTTNPKRRDPARADEGRCHDCHRAVSHAQIQVYGEAQPRQVPRTYPHEVLGAGNRPMVVWLCYSCLHNRLEAERAARS